MQGVLVIDRDFFTRSNVAQSEEQDVAVARPDVSVRLAAVIDVMRAVAAATAIQTPASINIADAELGTAAATLSF